MGPVAHELTIPGLLERSCAAHPQAGALAVPGGARVTYADLLERVRVGARVLLDFEVGAGERVAVWAPNSIEWVVASLAVASIGAQLVPLNTRWQLSEVLPLVERAGCGVWLAEDAFLGKSLSRSASGAWPGPVITLPSWDGLLERTDLPPDAELDARLAALSPDDVSHVQFTSGTTGRPKGVQLRHRAMVSTTASWVEIVGLRGTDRYPVVSPMAHIGGHKTGTLAALTAGATSLPVPRFDAKELLDLVAAEQVTVLQGPPTMFGSLIDAVDGGAPTPRTLQVAVTGSAVIPPALLRRMVSTLGIRQVHAGYGLTETTGVCTITRPGDPLDLVAESSGRAIEGVEVRIVGDDGLTAAARTRGEIVVRGPGTMVGYLDDPAATAETISADGWLATGDVGWLDEAGNLRIVDRIKDLIIVGGFNTSPAEIERVLEEHPLVAQAAVVGIPDRRLGEVPCAFVVPVSGATIDETALLAWAAERLAGYKQPRWVHVVDELPLTAVAKIDKQALAAEASTRGAKSGNEVTPA